MGKHKVPEATDLDLTPIMNMVMVLIPMMLLSVVFTAIHVIDVTMPQRSAGAAQNNGDPPKRLQLFISKQGFTIIDGMSPIPAIQGCPTGGPTICPNHPDEEIETNRHNWTELYNKLLEIKQQPDWNEHLQIEIVADSAINFGVLVKAMDISRYQLIPRDSESHGKGQKLDDNTIKYAKAVTKEGGSSEEYVDLFPIVILGMPTVSQ
jgi:biopolymer transport protein ExbD